MSFILNKELFLEVLFSHDWRNVQPNNRGRLNASSPWGLREDKNPSFSVIIDESSDAFGCWMDQGSEDPEWQRGGPIRLYMFLRNITEEEARDELCNGEIDAYATPKLRTKIRPPKLYERIRAIDVSSFTTDEVPYLTGRGITPEVQRMFSCGYDPDKRAVVMPWHSPDGAVLNAKWRATWSKAFWYAKGGAPVRNMIYGIHIVYSQRIKRVLITESETDAMYAWSCGVPAVAVGGSAFTNEKADLLRRSTVEELLIGADNDAAGEKLRREIYGKMRGYCAIADVRIPSNVKDVNEIGDAEMVRRICEISQRKNIFRNVQPVIANFRQLM